MKYEDKKLIVEGCGGKYKKYHKEDGCPAHWNFPSGHCVTADECPLDLNFYFKYAVPKLIKKHKPIWTFGLLTLWLRRTLLYGEDPKEVLEEILLKLIRETKCL